MSSSLCHVDQSHFNFDTLSPDDKAKKMQEEGKLRVKEHQSMSMFTIDVRIIQSSNLVP